MIEQIANITVLLFIATMALAINTLVVYLINESRRLPSVNITKITGYLTKILLVLITIETLIILNIATVYFIYSLYSHM